MSDSAPLGGVGRRGRAGRAGSGVEADRGGGGEEALTEANAQSVQGAGAVAFEAEQVFECPEDRLDALADRRQLRAAAGFVGAAGADDGRGEGADGGGEVAADVALVGDDDFPAG